MSNKTLHNELPSFVILYPKQQTITLHLGDDKNLLCV